MTDTDPDKWAKPTHVDDVTLAFPANVLGVLMPDWDDIPEAFRTGYHPESHGWQDFAETWVLFRLHVDTVVNLVEGIDGVTVLRHLTAISGSFEPKYQHKQAAMAWLASRWLLGARYAPATGPNRGQFVTVGEVGSDDG